MRETAASYGSKKTSKNLLSVVPPNMIIIIIIIIIFAYSRSQVVVFLFKCELQLPKDDCRPKAPG